MKKSIFLVAMLALSASMAMSGTAAVANPVTAVQTSGPVASAALPDASDYATADPSTDDDISPDAAAATVFASDPPN